ncbi:MAG: DUF1415 domain-containing protein [Betaproteobacteria bacterium]|nr:DUF1415 domain-containing protein [Betaproteobacteria bacterium]
MNATAPQAPDLPPVDTGAVIAATVRWVEKAVIGLDLCPFARGVHTGGRIRYAVTAAATTDELIDVLVEELDLLAAAAADAADAFETTLLIHPRVLGDFLDYNDFLDVADAAVEQLGLTGEVQVASFHPRYQFAGTEPDDIDNFTNRSPYPTLHLLREASIERAVAAYPDTDRIFEKNIETLRRLGRAGWDQLGLTAPDA